MFVRGGFTLSNEDKADFVNRIAGHLVDIFEAHFKECFGEDAEIEYTKGGCVAFAEILKELFPEGRILYDANHAVFNICGYDFDAKGKYPEGNYSEEGGAFFYPVSEWTRKEFEPVKKYSVRRIREYYPYFQGKEPEAPSVIIGL